MKELSEIHPPKDWAGCVGLSIELGHHPTAIAKHFGIKQPGDQEDMGIWKNIQTQSN